MKFLLKGVLVAGMAIAAGAVQAQSFEASSRVAQLMLGTGSQFGSTLATPPLGFLVENGIANDFLSSGWTLGSSYAVYSAGYRNADGYSHHLAGSFRFNVHFPIWERWDTYAGMGVGVAVFPKLSAGLVANVGARYALQGPWSIAAEAGYGLSWLNVGVGYGL
jgi:hypothetical protein